MSGFYALIVDVDFATGQRAGKIVRNHPNLRNHPSWINSILGKEMKLVEHGDATPYKNRRGVEIISGEDAIDDRAKELFAKVEYHLKYPEVLIEWIHQQDIDLHKVQNPKAPLPPHLLKRLTRRGVYVDLIPSDIDILERLYELGAPGISVIRTMPSTVDFVRHIAGLDDA